jgi:EAL domain-containing protein (putative c-di-GMP-specific phosphodiesterase class I)/AmiR/NasT family two-component response regulator
MRALIIDDEEQNIMLLKAILQRIEGLVTIATTDSTLASELFSQHRPDLVLVDLHMPGMDGVEVMAALNALITEDDFVPMVILSADTDRDARERVLEAGAHDFLVKPLDLSEVVLRTRSLLRTRTLHLKVESQRAALAEQLERHERREREASEHRHTAARRVRDVLDRRAIAIAFQPIADINDGRVIGLEALSRFETEPLRGPDLWFAEAKEVGLGAELELVAIDVALAQLPEIPADMFVSINVSPEHVADGHLAAHLRSHPAERVVVEITEHAPVEDYSALLEHVSELRSRGTRLAVDDAGAGFASLQHILRLEPDFIKLDLSLTRDIDTDPVRRALASSLVTFAKEVGAYIVAEGIETAGEQGALSRLGVSLGQGYYLGRPAPLPAPTVVLAAKQ